MSLPAVLRIAALLLVCAATAELFVLGELLPAPFAIAALLLLLSFAMARWLRPVSFVVLVLSILIPIGALLEYLRGHVVVAVPIFDAVLFGWVFWTAWRESQAVELVDAA